MNTERYKRARIDVLKLIDETIPVTPRQAAVRQRCSAFELRLHDKLMPYADAQTFHMERLNEHRRLFETGETTLEQYVTAYSERWIILLDIIHMNDALINDVCEFLEDDQAARLWSAFGAELFPYLWQQDEGNRALDRAIAQTSSPVRMKLLRNTQQELRELRLSWTHRLREIQLRWESSPTSLNSSVAQRRLPPGQRAPDPLGDQFADLSSQAREEIAALQEQAIRVAEDDS